MTLDRTRLVILAALLAGAVLAAVVEFAPRNNDKPAPDGGLSLRGKWIGPQAAEDAAAFAGLCRGMSAALRVDGSKGPARIVTGVQLEDMRISAAEGRFLPRSLSREQPHAMAAVGRYLDSVVGTSGGPLTPETKERWAAALDAAADAAEEAVR